MAASHKLWSSRPQGKKNPMGGPSRQVQNLLRFWVPVVFGSGVDGWNVWCAGIRCELGPVCLGWVGPGLARGGPGAGLEGCPWAGFARAGPGEAGPMLGRARPGWAGAEARAHQARPGQAQDFFFTASSLSPDFCSRPAPIFSKTTVFTMNYAPQKQKFLQ